MNSTVSALAFASVAGIASCAMADTLNFEGLPIFGQVGEQYAANGAHFALTDTGVQEGLGGGDSGNWGIEGTNGSAFMGFNGSPSYGMQIDFDAPFTSYSMDVSRSNGSAAGDSFHYEFWLGGVFVVGGNFVFNPVNQWTTLTFTGLADRVTFHSEGDGFHPYGVDNITFNVPTPGAAAALGLAGLGTLRRRRSR